MLSPGGIGATPGGPQRRIPPPPRTRTGAIRLVPGQALTKPPLLTNRSPRDFGKAALAATAALVMTLSPGPAMAKRMEGVNKPELLPAEPNVTVIDIAGECPRGRPRRRRPPHPPRGPRPPALQGVPASVPPGRAPHPGP